jgi:hypothetical protein
MSLEEFENTPDKKTKRYIVMRSITDIGMGIIYLAFGVFIFFAKQFNFHSEFAGSIPAKIVSVLAVIYGVWRIYRGSQKKYFRE